MVRVLSLLLLLGATLSAQPVELKVTSKLEGGEGAKVGGEVSVVLLFTVPRGYHTYHKDSTTVPPLELAIEATPGLKPTGQKWPEPKRKPSDIEAGKDDLVLEGGFDIRMGWLVEQPGNHSITITVDGQICDADACIPLKPQPVLKHSFTAAPAAKAAGVQPPAGRELPTADNLVTISAVLGGPLERGKTSELHVFFDVFEHFHVYPKDNQERGGLSQGLAIKLTLPSGVKVASEAWPVAKKVEDPLDWQLEGTFAVVYRLEVESFAPEAGAISATYEAQVCDAEGCKWIEGGFNLPVKITGAAGEARPAVDLKPLTDKIDELGREIGGIKAALDDLRRGPAPTKDEHGFFTDYEAARKAAIEAKHLLLIDFNGFS